MTQVTVGSTLLQLFITILAIAMVPMDPMCDGLDPATQTKVSLQFLMIHKTARRLGSLGAEKGQLYSLLCSAPLFSAPLCCAVLCCAVP